MKRESGENPEQTRCCKLRLRAEQRPHLPLSPEGMGRRSDTGASQKTCRHFATVNGFRGIKLENDTQENPFFYYVFHFHQALPE